MARPVFKRGLSINQTKPNVGREDSPKVTDLVEMYDWPKKGGAGQIRATGPIQGRALHKVKVRKKDGSDIEITKVCLSYNVETDDFDPDVPCPYCKMPEGFQVRKKRYFMNVIDRRIEEDAPAKVKRTAEETTSGYKDMDSNSWTPVRVLGVPSTVAMRLQDLSGKNIVKNKTGQKKAFDFNDNRFGFDLDVSFDKNKPAANMYSCDRNTEERFTPLDETTLDYLLWDLDTIYQPEELAQARNEAKGLTDRWKKATGAGDDEVDDDEEETDRHPRSGKGKSNGKKPAARGRQADEYGDDDDDAEGGEDDELDLDGEEEGGYEEDEPPKRGKKQPPKRGKQADEYEEEEGEEEGEEDEYADDDSGEEGEEEDGFDEEEEDAPPPKRGAKKPAPARNAKPAPKRGRQEEEYDDESEEEGEEEDEYEEAPPPRRAKPAAGKPAGRPAPGKKPAGKPAAGKRRPAASDDLDDLDDDIPF